MVAEKKLDRAKSQAVAKFEQQGISSGSNRAGGNSNSAGVDPTEKGASGVTDGVDRVGNNSDLERARRETAAVVEKQREQIDSLEVENQNLTERVTTLSVKVDRSSAIS